MTNMNTVSHGGTSVYTGMESRFDDAKAELKEIGEMREQIKNNPDLSDSEKESMLADLDRAETAINQALDYATNSTKYDTTSNNVRNDGDLAAFEAAMSRAQDSMNHVEQELMIAARFPADVSAPPNAQGTDASNGAQGASGAGGAKSASGAGGVGAMEFGGKTVDEMSNMMNNDPQALMDHLDTLEPEDRQMAMQMMMQQLQEMNQMFSMMSNMMKSLHDTAKAAINNMRV